MITYDSLNAVLFLSDISECDQNVIDSWLDDNIALVLSNKRVIRRRYYDGLINVNITVVCSGFVVGVYKLADNKLYIQTVGYNNCLKSQIS